MPRYQNGTLELKPTAAGPTWYIRFTDQDGKRPRFRIGTKAKYPSQIKASVAAQPTRDAFNNGALLAKPAYTVSRLIDRYEAEEMPTRYSSARTYRKIHKLYLTPRWGTVELKDIAPLDVRAWLRELKLQNGGMMSSRSRGAIHSHFKNLLKHAMLWKWMPAQVNPLSLFSLEGSTKRTRTPRVITADQFRELLGAVGDDEPLRTMLIVAFCLGLRVSEICGLKWEDIDLIGGTIHIRRNIVRGHEGPPKTERSEAPLPLAPQLIATLAHWKLRVQKQNPMHREKDWVFASKLKAGRQPIDANKLQSRWMIRAGQQIGLTFPLGWHTLRHSYKTLLDRVSSDPTLKRDLMRHSDVHTTMQVYGEVEMDRLRTANAAAVALIMPEAIN